MQTDDIFRLPVQSLRLLQVVFQERSLTAAAERFDINQSSVSYTIDRLRAVFKDPLFVRVGRGIEPTQRCGEIVQSLEQIIDDLLALTQNTTFDPETSHAHFTLSCNFHERVVLLPEIMRRLQDAAPNARLTVIQASTAAARQLRDGECDIAISPEGADQPGILHERLFSERYSCFVDPGHPFANATPDLPAYLAADHVVVRYREGWQPYYMTYLSGLGHGVRAVLEVPSLGGLQALIPGTSLVLTAPSMMRSVFEPALAHVPAPFDVTFHENLLWTERNDAAPAHRWLRALVREAARVILVN